MKILLARTAGFCMGVRRAVELAVEAVRESGAPACSLGPLIHNRQACDLLEARGIRVLDPDTQLDQQDLDRTGTVVIRAHGVEPSVRQRLESDFARVVDGTCPHVLLSQRRIRQASDEGREIVLAGDPDHPEVLALRGAAATRVHPIRTEDDARQVEPAGAFILIGQTTFSRERYDAMGEILRERFGERCIVFDSICNATAERQAEAQRLTAIADALVVVGGVHSANTRRLADIGREAGRPTFHVETANELRREDFRDFHTVAVTAGASTPGWLTQQVIDRLEGFGRTSGGGRLLRLLRLAGRLRLTTAVGAAGLSLAVQTLLGLDQPIALELWIASLYVFYAYTLNRREPPHPQNGEPLVIDPFYHRYRSLLNVLAGVALAAAMLLATRQGPGMLLLVSTAALLASLYAVRLLPRHWRLLCVKDLPLSKDLAVAAAWAYVVVGGVVLAATQPLAAPAVAAAALTVFVLSLASRILLDLRDMESDHLIGIETLPILVGRRRAIHILYALGAAIALEMPLMIWAGWFSPFALVFALVPVYSLVVLHHLARSRFRGETNCQLLVDGQLWLAGLLALAWRLL